MLPGDALPGEVLPGDVLPGEVLPGDVLPDMVDPPLREVDDPVDDPEVDPGIDMPDMPDDPEAPALPPAPPGVDRLPEPLADPLGIEPLDVLPDDDPPDGAVWAVTAVANNAADSAITIFMMSLLYDQRGGGLVVGVVPDTPDVVGKPAWPVTPGVVAPPGASVPTRPSPMVPEFDAPIGGVTPIDGCGSAPGDVDAPNPAGAVPANPGGGAAPAGEYGAAALPAGLVWANAGVVISTAIAKALIMLAS